MLLNIEANILFNSSKNYKTNVILHVNYICLRLVTPYLSNIVFFKHRILQTSYSVMSFIDSGDSQSFW